MRIRLGPSLVKFRYSVLIDFTDSSVQNHTRDRDSEEDSPSMHSTLRCSRLLRMRNSWICGNMFLDEAHTRCTDLKLPQDYRAVVNMIFHRSTTRSYLASRPHRRFCGPFDESIYIDSNITTLLTRDQVMEAFGRPEGSEKTESCVGPELRLSFILLAHLIVSRHRHLIG